MCSKITSLSLPSALNGLSWANDKGVSMTNPRMAFLMKDGHAPYYITDRMRIAYKPRPLTIAADNSSASSPRANVPKYNLPLSTEGIEDQFVNMEDAFCQLLWERKDLLFSAQAQKKIKDAVTVKEFFYKSCLYKGDSERAALFTPKMPLVKNDHSKFKVTAFVMEGDMGQKVELTQDNYGEWLKGGNEVEAVFKLRGVVIVNDKAFPMIDLVQLKLYENALPDEEDDELDDDAILQFERPVLQRQTNEPLDDTRANKRTRGK